MLALLSFLSVLVIVVSVHEYGHYIAARLCKVRVLRFSIGFGPALLSYRDKRQTLWSVAPIPLGGFVHLMDTAFAKDNHLDSNDCIDAKPHWQRIFIYAAGPFANLVLSAVVIMVVLLQGEVGINAEIGSVRSHSIAEQAGLKPNQTINKINDNEVLIWRHVKLELLDASLAGQPFEIETANQERYVIDKQIDFDDLVEGVDDIIGIAPRNDFILPQVSYVQKDSPADKADIKSQDELVLINKRIIDTWQDALAEIQQNPNRLITLVVWRDGTPITTTALLDSAEIKGGKQIGRLGITPIIDRGKLSSLLTTVHFSPLELVQEGIGRAWDDVNRTVQFIVKLFQGKASSKHISGPIGVATHSKEAASQGFYSWLRFIAFISISLAVINMLPFPVLDGGQIVLNMLEYCYGHRFSERWMMIWNAIGVTLMLALFVYLIVTDIARLL